LTNWRIASANKRCLSTTICINSAGVGGGGGGGVVPHPQHHDHDKDCMPSAKCTANEHWWCGKFVDELCNHTTPSSAPIDALMQCT
jgi:hypothetical protein